MAMDYVGFGSEILSVLKEMGNPFNLTVPSVSAKSATGKKSVTTYTTYSGTCVKAKYDSDFVTKDTVIKAGDLKFVCQFDDLSFEPVNDKDETIIYGGKNYKVINVDPVEPNGTDNVVYIIQGRRVN